MFDAAIAAAQPARCLPPHLPEPPKGRTIVVGAGKASAAMAKAFDDAWMSPVSGIVVTRYGYAVPCRRIEIVEAALLRRATQVVACTVHDILLAD
jgi:glycerate 2-kinase